MALSVDSSNYLHTYQAYRIPKGTSVKNAAGNIDFSSFKTINLGGVIGEFIDLSF